MNTPLNRQLEMLVRITEENEALRDTLRTVQDLLYTMPCGVDLDADPENESPVDAMAHVAGLCIREIDKVLKSER